MVRRALSLRQGRVLELEIETNTTSVSVARSMSFGDGKLPTSQDDGARTSDMMAGQRSRRGSSVASLPLSWHHQIMRRRSSVVVNTISTTTISPIIDTISARNGNRTRTRTDSSTSNSSSSSSSAKRESMTTPLTELGVVESKNTTMAGNGDRDGDGRDMNLGTLSSLLDYGLAGNLDEDDGQYSSNKLQKSP